MGESKFWWVSQVITSDDRYKFDGNEEGRRDRKEEKVGDWVEDVCVSMKQSRKKIVEVRKLMGWGEGKDKYNRKVKRKW